MQNERFEKAFEAGFFVLSYLIYLWKFVHVTKIAVTSVDWVFPRENFSSCNREEGEKFAGLCDLRRYKC